MCLDVIVAEVADVIELALELETHLEAAEPVVVVDGLGVGAVVFKIAADEFCILELLGGGFRHLANVVERYGNVGGEAGNEGPQILAQVHVGKHLCVGVLVLAGLLELCHGVAVAVNG